VTPIKVRPPSEDFEAKRLTAYLTARGWRHTHIANETASKRQAVKNKSMGTSRGVPDYLIIHPKAGLVFIELKRARGGRISAFQKEWIEALNTAGVPARVCNGFNECKKWLEEL
jgi:hypothetical protein